jgi:hypothetical protein
MKAYRRQTYGNDRFFLMNRLFTYTPRIDDGWGVPTGDIEVSLSRVPYLAAITRLAGDGSETCGL